MIRNYLHIFTNLPGILARINSELEGKASKASLDALRYTVGRKADTNFVVSLSEIINERFAERPTHADIVLVKEEIGVRLELLEAVQPKVVSPTEEEFQAALATMLPAEKTGEPSFHTLFGERIEDKAVIETISALQADHMARGKFLSVETIEDATGVKVDFDKPFGQRVTLPTSIKKDRKPRTPKGGAK